MLGFRSPEKLRLLLLGGWGGMGGVQQNRSPLLTVQKDPTIYMWGICWGPAILKLLLEGSWDLVTRVFIRVTILIAPIKVLITPFTKSHDPPSISVR